jgi:hypothetical protein
MLGARWLGNVATGAVLLTAAGCGGGGHGKPSKDVYYRSIDRFCGYVATAARQVSDDTHAVKRDKNATQRQVVKVVSASLLQFADATETALDHLHKVNVPDDFATFQRATDTGYRSFVKTLRTTAGAARKDGPKALAQFGPKLSAVKLPDTPPEIAANAKRCAGFTPKG